MDNDQSYIRTTAELFKVADNKPLRFRCRAQYTEANVDDANVFLGFANAIAAELLIDDGAGLRTTGNYFCFFKLDGGTTWQVRSRNGTETETHDTGITAGGAAYHVFGIDIDNEGDGSSNVRVTFTYDGNPCYDAANPEKRITHTILIASSTEMHAGAGQKNGDNTNVETLNLDWIYASQKR